MAANSFFQREIAQKVLIHLAKGVAIQIDRRQQAQQHALGVVVHRFALVGRGVLGGQCVVNLREAFVGMAQKDQAQPGCGKFGRFEAGVGPELVSGGLKPVFNCDEIRCHGVPVDVGALEACVARVEGLVLRGQRQV